VEVLSVDLGFRRGRGSSVDVLVATGAPDDEGRADEVCAATASTVARLESSRCSDSPAVPHRTCSSRRWLRLEDDFVDLVHVKSPNRVREVREEMRELEVGERWREGADVRRNRR
jgi:hypothetical protein